MSIKCTVCGSLTVPCKCGSYWHSPSTVIPVPDQPVELPLDDYDGFKLAFQYLCNHPSTTIEAISEACDYALKNRNARPKRESGGRIAELEEKVEKWHCAAMNAGVIVYKDGSLGYPEKFELKLIESAPRDGTPIIGWNGKELYACYWRLEPYPCWGIWHSTVYDCDPIGWLSMPKNLTTRIEDGATDD